ncbi:uncharacterized protein B0J16DRAFT_400370 [Fusarium flagelliforme]|uniref:uncharacterized protein n=1 Tax=Fusarium flagelliforme TaxID=2675880 RepID=UPI001E8D5EF6|nr:uncharacterized protein B0J16DRAFT_400370 [Fusarium flagelliforme]KAH7186281.1 hypothetical protein B0J16DRAFT_400370 [Fusarium flagelliforme]
MDFLPDEIVNLIIANTTAHELTQLSRTCKRLNRLAEPQLWTNIEFHHQSFHELSDSKHSLPKTSAPQRFYCGEPEFEYSGACKAEDFFKMLQDLLVENVERLIQLCARVKSICTAVELDTDFWQFLPYFINIKTLELYGDSSYRCQEAHKPFDPSAAPLTKLHYVKLDGTIPRPIVAWILSSCSNIEWLELALLDRPISSRETIEDDFPRLPEDLYSPPEYPTYGRLTGWAAIPQPLSNFLPWLKDGKSLMLTRLRHLQLCQPSHSNLSTRMVSYFWSTTAEVAAHKDWEKILQASCATLETLVVEQRIGIEHGDGATDETDGFFRRDQDGSGSERLSDMLERVMTEKRFPALQRVYLKGIVVGSEKRGEPIGDVPGGRFMRFLEKMGIECEARLEDGLWFDGKCGSGPSAEWHFSDDETEEELLARI